MSAGVKVALSALAALALVGGVIGFVALTRPPPRPPGTGDVGVLMVFAQTPGGPVRLRPGRKVRLPRPQDFAFRFVAEGTGPRFVRIELEDEQGRVVVFEEKMTTPADGYLDYTLRLDERAADDVVLTAVVEAPHMMSAVSDFPIRLEGAERPFWEPTEPRE